MSEFILGDCMEYLPKYEDNHFDYCFTSPPYNVGGNNLNGEGKKYNSLNDKLTPLQYYEWQKSVIKELLRVCKYHVFYNVQALSGNKSSIYKLIGEFNKSIKDILIWDKKHGTPAMEPGVFNAAFEFIIILSNDHPEKRKFYDVDFQGTIDNVLRTKNKHHNEFSDIHKAVFPLELPRLFMQTFKHNKWVDPFGGTGTTNLAAEMENKTCVGYELDKDYYQAANKRLANHKAQLRIFK